MQNVIKHIVVALLFVVGGTTDAQGQFLSTRLPTEVGGDFGNGAATSDAAGGMFVGPEVSASPATAFGIPTAFGADWRDVYAAVGYQRLFMPAIRQNDGAVFMGGGVGNAGVLVGAEVTFAVYDLKDTPLKQRSLGVKIHRRLGEHGAMAFGMENMIATSGTDGGKSIYGVASYSSLFSQRGYLIRSLTISFGIGNGRFNSMKNVRQGRNGIGVFGSVSIQASSWLSVYGTWAGQDLNTGLSFAPLDEVPVVFTLAAVNISGLAESGRRLAVSVGFGSTVR